jgi:hypothetical protein
MPDSKIKDGKILVRAHLLKRNQIDSNNTNVLWRFTILAKI